MSELTFVSSSGSVYVVMKDYTEVLGYIVRNNREGFWLFQADEFCSLSMPELDGIVDKLVELNSDLEVFGDDI